uniref:Seipin n=1 Tax=Geospiza parvula TaxID=87175 RepID=A0A8U8C7J6_GEOPR
MGIPLPPCCSPGGLSCGWGSVGAWPCLTPPLLTPPLPFPTAPPMAPPPPLLTWGAQLWVGLRGGVAPFNPSPLTPPPCFSSPSPADGAPMAPGGFPAAPPPPLLTWGAQVGRGARRALLRGALGLSLALLLLWAAVFLYGSFYWAYLPADAVLRPLHLGFRSDCERPGPELCSFPTANVSLLGEHREKVLLYGQLYRISLELELPESPVNRELGMFMVGLSLYGQGGKTLARSERAAMLHYRSRLLRALHTAAFAGLFLSGFAEQSQTLELELMGRYREDPYSPTAGALVEIRSRRVQLYGARLRVHAHFSGLRYLLYHFPLTSAVVGVAGNWTLLALLTLGGYLQWGRGPQRPRPRPAQTFQTPPKIRRSPKSWEPRSPAQGEGAGADREPRGGTGHGLAGGSRGRPRLGLGPRDPPGSGGAAGGAPGARGGAGRDPEGAVGGRAGSARAPEAPPRTRGPNRGQEQNPQNLLKAPKTAQGPQSACADPRSGGGTGPRRGRRGSECGRRLRGTRRSEHRGSPRPPRPPRPSPPRRRRRRGNTTSAGSRSVSPTAAPSRRVSALGSRWRPCGSLWSCTAAPAAPGGTAGAPPSPSASAQPFPGASSPTRTWRNPCRSWAWFPPPSSSWPRRRGAEGGTPNKPKKTQKLQRVPSCAPARAASGSQVFIGVPVPVLRSPFFIGVPVPVLGSPFFIGVPVPVLGSPFFIGVPQGSRRCQRPTGSARMTMAQPARPAGQGDTGGHGDTWGSHLGSHLGSLPLPGPRDFREILAPSRGRPHPAPLISMETRPIFPPTLNPRPLFPGPAPSPQSPPRPSPAAKVIWAMPPMEGAIPFFMAFRGPWYTQTAAMSSPAPLSRRQLQQPPNSGRGEPGPGPGTGAASGAASAPRGRDMAGPEETLEVSVIYSTPGATAQK